MIDEIKVLLGPAASNFTEEQIGVCAKHAVAEVKAYCHREMDVELELIALKIAILKLNRLNTEGLSAQSFSGVSESFIDGYPADILKVLNSKRKIKVM